MRFSTQMMYQQNMRGITNSQAEWMKYGEQMSTGKRVVNPSDHCSITSRSSLPGTGAKQPVHAGTYFRHSKSVTGRECT